MFGMGTAEVALIAGVLVLLIGPSQLPRFAAGLGKTVRILRRDTKDLREALSSGDDD